MNKIALLTSFGSYSDMLGNQGVLTEAFYIESQCGRNLLHIGSRYSKYSGRSPSPSGELNGTNIPVRDSSLPRKINFLYFL